MELIELTPEALHKLRSEGYKYLVHTKPSVEEELALECCELEPVKYIPVRDIVEAEDYERTYGFDTFKVDFDEVEYALVESHNGTSLYKNYIEKRYIEAA